MNLERPSVRRAVTSVFCAVALAVHAPILAQSTLPTDAEIRPLLEARVAEGGAPSLAVGVFDPSGTRFLGVGSVAGEGPATPDEGTIFEIGSIAKVLTGLLLAEMTVRGEVDLDEPISAFLPDSVSLRPGPGREITLLDLATHTSGLPSVPSNLDPADPANPWAGYGAEELYRFLESHAPARPPGEAYEYSNLAVGLLGHLLSLRAGRSYEGLVTERILGPLGMHDTAMEVPAPSAGRVAQGHGPDLEPSSAWDWDVLQGAGAWRSTPRDVLLLLEAAAAPPPGPLGEAFTASMEPRRPTDTPNLQIGLGWHILQLPDRSISWHNGQTGGFRAFAGVDPASGTGVVVLANSATDIDDIGLHLLEPGIPLREMTPPRAEITLDPEVLDRYVGRYQLAPEFAIEITRDGDALFAQATGQSRLRIHAESPTRFFFRAVDAELEFTRDEDGRVVGLVLHQGGVATPGRKSR